MSLISNTLKFPPEKQRDPSKGLKQGVAEVDFEAG